MGAHHFAQARAPAGGRSDTTGCAKRVVRDRQTHPASARSPRGIAENLLLEDYAKLLGGKARITNFILPQLSRLAFIERKNKIIHEGPLLDLAFDYAEMAPRILQGALADLLKKRGVLADAATEGE